MKKGLACSWGKRKCDYCFRKTDVYTLDRDGWRVCKACQKEGKGIPKTED